MLESQACIEEGGTPIGELERLAMPRFSGETTVPGFTDEELDFIINYDIKHRMGQEAEEESD